MSLDWQLRVWTPTGEGPRIIERDDTFIRSTGLRMRISTESDGIEASFDAKGAGILIPPLSAVQVLYREFGALTPLYYGQVRQGGNSRDVNGERYVLRSLALRLKYVTLPVGFSTPKQPAHLTVRAVIEAVMPQLGGLILFEPLLVDDLGFDCRAIENGHQQNVYALLESIVADGAGMGVKVRFGVARNRYFYIHTALDNTVTLAESDVRNVKWEAPVAEDPCTVVRWFIAKDGNNWITYDSVSPEAEKWGRWVKSVSVDSSIKAWENLPGTYTFWAQDSNRRPLPPVTLNVSEAGNLQDGKAATAVTYTFPPAQPFGFLQFAPTGAADRVIVQAGTSTAGGGIGPGVMVGSKPAANDMLYAGGETRSQRGWFDAAPALGVAAGEAAYVTFPGFEVGSTNTLTVAELRAERVNRALLDRLAQHHYSVPAQAPADLALLQYLPPNILGGKVKVGSYEANVEAWEYRLDAATGLTTAALIGQADKPEDLARADLIKARDAAAVIQAINAP